MKINFCNINNYVLKSTKKINPFATDIINNNLKPLAKDTVSFSGKSELIAQTMVYAPSNQLCKTTSENATPAHYYLSLVLDEYLKPLTKQSGNSKDEDAPVLKIESRIKSPVSIREKVVTKYTKLCRKEFESFANTIIDKLDENYKINPQYTKKDILKIIKKSTDTKDSYPKGTILYENYGHNFEKMLDIMKENNCFNFDDYPQNVQNQINDEIIEKLQTISEQYINKTEIEPTCQKGVKYYANDIVGARIILKNSYHDDTTKVLNALGEAVKDGKLKITSIQNNIPSPDKLPKGVSPEKYSYAPYRIIEKLANTAGAELMTTETPSGYQAIHINVDLSHPLLAKYYDGKFNGYSGEIQIIGRDVAQLKEVEDLCYKLKDKKNAIKAEYKPFKDHFTKYWTKENKDVFDEYTYKLYLSQHDIPGNKKRRTKFPTIEELGFSKKLTPQLDFNLLKNLKQYCDYQIEINEKQNSQNVNTQVRSANEIKKQGDIQTMKQIIENDYRK